MHALTLFCTCVHLELQDRKCTGHPVSMASSHVPMISARGNEANCSIALLTSENKRRAEQDPTQMRRLPCLRCTDRSQATGLLRKRQPAPPPVHALRWLALNCVCCGGE